MFLPDIASTEVLQKYIASEYLNTKRSNGIEHVGTNWIID